MRNQFDVFAGSPIEPVWLESADGLNSAIIRMEQRAWAKPGRYFVSDGQRVIASIDTNRAAKGQNRMGD